MRIVRIGAIWCPGCLIMKNRWSTIEQKNQEHIYEEYDYDQEEEYCKSLQIGSKLPVVIFFDGEKELGRLTGEKTEKELYKALDEYGGKQ